MEDSLLHKKTLIGVSIIVVVFLILGSIIQVVGYQTVQATQKNLIQKRGDQKQLLFQTLLDISHNKKIQKILHQSPMIKTPLYPHRYVQKPLTKLQLRRMCVLGQFFLQTIGTQKIQSIIQKHQFITPDMHQKINAVIANDPHLNEEITQLLSSDCGCDTSKTTEWGFPVICTALLGMMGFAAIPWVGLMIFFMIPPNAFDDMLELLFLMLSPFLILWERFNCHLPEINHPFPSDPSPSDGEQNVSLDIKKLSFTLTD